MPDGLTTFTPGTLLNSATIKSRFRSMQRRSDSTSSCGPSIAPSAPAWHRLDVHEVVCDWRVPIAPMISSLAMAQPIRNPVIPYVFATPLTTIRLLALVSRVVKS